MAAMIHGSAHVLTASQAEGNAEETESNSAKVHYKPPFKFAIGAVPTRMHMLPLRPHGMRVSATLIWRLGTDSGLAERRYGNFLHDKPRNEFIVASQVGKLVVQKRS